MTIYLNKIEHLVGLYLGGQIDDTPLPPSKAKQLATHFFAQLDNEDGNKRGTVSLPQVLEKYEINADLAFAVIVNLFDIPEESAMDYYQGVHMRDFHVCYRLIADFISEAGEGKSARKIARAFERLATAFQRDHNYSSLIKRIQTGQLVILTGGRKGHALHILFYRGYYVVCNTGYGAPREKTCLAHKIDATALSVQHINSLVAGFLLEKEHSKPAFNYIYNTLPKNLLATRDAVCSNLEKLSFKKQDMGNCLFKSAEAVIQAAAFLLQMPHPEEFAETVFWHARWRFLGDCLLSGYSTRTEEGNPTVVGLAYESFPNKLATDPSFQQLARSLPLIGKSLLCIDGTGVDFAELLPAIAHPEHCNIFPCITRIEIIGRTTLLEPQQEFALRKVFPLLKVIYLPNATR